MWIKYSYDVGSISHNTESFCLVIPEEIVNRGLIKHSEIILLLHEHYAYLSETSLISYYCHKNNAYRRLQSTGFLELVEGQDIEILIKGCTESEFAFLIDKINDLDERLWGLEQRLGNQEEASPSYSSKEDAVIDIAMLYAAPLVRQEGIKIRDCDN